MSWTLLGVFDLVGTIAFAISGAFVGIYKKMDIFGINVMAVTTACGGGLMRDLIIGNTPPAMFRNPFYVGIAVIVANIVFLLVRYHKKMPRIFTPLYERMYFWFDTVGLAAFTVDGVMIGINAGFADNEFLICFLGFLTGVGGGALRDIMADDMPGIFKKHVYALASIIGAISMTILHMCLDSWKLSMIGAFVVIIVMRYCAVEYEWNLPRV